MYLYFFSLSFSLRDSARSTQGKTLSYRFITKPLSFYFFKISRLYLLVAFIAIAGNKPLWAQQPQNGAPDPLRFEEEIAEFEAWDAKNTSPDNALLFTGSSSIRFWKSAESFPGYSVINRGFGGSQISDMLHYYDQIIGRYSPSLIILYSGENDIASGKAIYHVFEDYLALLERISRDFPQTPVLFISIKSSSSRADQTERFAAFNRMIEAHSRTSRTLYYADLSSTLTKNGRPDDSYFREDLLHLNERGYELWNERLGAFLAQLEENGVFTGRRNE